MGLCASGGAGRDLCCADLGFHTQRLGRGCTNAATSPHMKGMHLAEFNFGRLAYPWDDPRIAGFQDAVEQVNAIGGCSPGFVWRIADEDMEAAQYDPDGPFNDGPHTASTLSVWEDAASLYNFVTKTLHARIMKGAPDWFVPEDSGHLVCWWVPIGAQPTVAEGMAEWVLLQNEGDSAARFGGQGLKQHAVAQQAENPA